MPTPTTPAPQATKDPLITPEADRAIFKIMVLYFGTAMVLVIITPLVLSPLNLTSNPFYKFHRAIDYVSTLIFMIPFFMGMSKVNAAKLNFGRKYAEEQDWRAVYGAVESFAQIGQKWMDRDGEAHYLLAIAYERLGKKVEAEKARKFITSYRADGEWAKKLREVEASRAPRRISEMKADKDVVVKKLSKARRRF